MRYACDKTLARPAPLLGSFTHWPVRMSSPAIVAATVIGGAFSLTDHYGAPVSDLTYHGSHVLMFFGFTHCRVICPRALAKLSEALDRIGPLADRVQALYVTVDPVRDTPAVMRAFLQKHYPRFTGLTASIEQIDAAKTAFRIFALRRDEPDGGYQVPHTAFTYVLDRQGRLIEHWPETIGVDEIVVHLEKLLSC